MKKISLKNIVVLFNIGSIQLLVAWIFQSQMQWMEWLKSRKNMKLFVSSTWWTDYKGIEFENRWFFFFLNVIHFPREGIIQPARIGDDGKPHAVEHVLQLQEGIGLPDSEKKDTANTAD